MEARKPSGMLRPATRYAIHDAMSNVSRALFPGKAFDGVFD
jgi:hypothetical protein